MEANNSGMNLSGKIYKCLHLEQRLAEPMAKRFDTTAERSLNQS